MFIELAKMRRSVKVYADKVSYNRYGRKKA